MVGYVAPDGAAAQAGIREGDQVVQIDDIVIPTWEDIAMKEISSAQRPMQVWVQRGTASACTSPSHRITTRNRNRYGGLVSRKLRCRSEATWRM